MVKKKVKYWSVEGVRCFSSYEWENDLENSCASGHDCSSCEIGSHQLCFSEADAKKLAEDLIQKNQYVDIWGYDADGKACPDAESRCWAQPEEKITAKWS